MTVYRDRKTGTHRYDFMFRGRRYTKRGFETKTAARDAAHDHKRLLKAGRTDPFQTFREMVGAFLASSQRTKSANWCSQLEMKLNKGFPHLADLHPREITRGHIEPKLDRLARNGNQARSINEYRKIINAVMNYGLKMRALDFNPRSRDSPGAGIGDGCAADPEAALAAAHPRGRAAYASVAYFSLSDRGQIR